MAATGTGGPSGPRRNARHTSLDADGPLPGEMLRALLSLRRDPLDYLARTVARYGDLVAFPVPGAPALLVNDPAGVRRVLQDNHRGYTKATVQYAALATVTGTGLLTSDGEVWRRHRRVLRPAFHHSGLPAVADRTGAAAQRLLRRWDAAPGGVLDADAAIMRTMLEVVGSTLFAADLGPAADRVVPAVDAALALLVRRAASPVPAGWPTRSGRRLRRAVAVLDEACHDVVRQRLSAGLGERDTDVLALLLRALGAGSGAGAGSGTGGGSGAGGGAVGPGPAGGDPGGDALTGTEVRDELVTLVIAGYETVASCLVWSLHLLAGHPDVQDALVAELAEVLGPGPDARPPGWSDLSRLPLTRAVLDESLRLFPPAWVITRRAVDEDVVAGVTVPAGTLVIISPWLLHRRPQAWPQPWKFDPGRFLDRPGAGAPGGDYLPFGAGPRLCIGRDLALVEAVLVLATLLRGRRVTHARPGPSGSLHPVRAEALVTLRPRHGLPLRLTTRSRPRRPGP